MTTDTAGTLAPMGRPRRLGRAALVTQWMFVGLALAGVGGLYLRGLAVAGSHAALIATPIDPKDALGPDVAWNPLLLVFLPIALVAMFAVPLGIVCAAPGLALAYLTGLRQDRRLRRQLTVASVLCLLVVVVALTPFGREVQLWMLD